jgi:hypothetical protein
LWCGLKDRVYLKEGRERIERGGSVGGREKIRGLLAKPPFSSSPWIQNRGGIGGDQSGRRQRLPALPGMAAAGVRGKRER